MNAFARLRSRLTALVHDVAMIPVAWFGAYWLRFNLEAIPDPFWSQALLLLPVIWISQGSMFWYFGLYRGIWRFASVPDLVRIVKAVAVGVGISVAASFVLTRLVSVPRSVFLLDGFLLLLLLGGPRFFYRWLKDRHLYSSDGKRTLIVGAGRAGEMLARDMLRDSSSPYRPVGFVDDDRAKQGREVHGLPVGGGVDRIEELARRYDAELIVIALPSASSRELRRIVELCESTGLPFRALPRLQDMVSGQVGLKDLRDVNIEDLLGREPVRLDWRAIEEGLRGRVVLVTGGGGSIGSELCRQIGRLRPERLVVFEHSEFNLFTIEQELRNRYPDLPLVCVLGDVCDAVDVERTFEIQSPEVVFHAAAYKHVPMLEHQVRAAILNNVFGTQTVATVAERHGCRTFILISSDKAVNPGNVMGATKRVAEMICQDLASRSKTRFVTVRFGNVLGSSGSVVPLFREQIARGGPVTVTHPDVTRYFMTIPEACQLILQASVIGAGGEIFVLDMGDAIKIAYLAEQMIQLSGKRPGEDVEIIYTGLRPGEKLHEELFHDAEQLAPTRHAKIRQAHPRPISRGLLDESIASFKRLGEQVADEKMREVLARLVPELRGQTVADPEIGIAGVVPLKKERDSKGG
jgi:FlaA1/EpsC-like NDP-sugar epimerase